jgi:hypothetical protein
VGLRIGPVSGTFRTRYGLPLYEDLPLFEWRCIRDDIFVVLGVGKFILPVRLHTLLGTCGGFKQLQFLFPYRFRFFFLASW